jgi:hypothetical protein
MEFESFNDFKILYFSPYRNFHRSTDNESSYRLKFDNLTLKDKYGTSTTLSNNKEYNEGELIAYFMFIKSSPL